MLNVAFVVTTVHSLASGNFMARGHHVYHV